MPAPVLTLSATTSSALTFNVNNTESAATNILVEVNRAIDFASDDTLYASYNLPAGNTAVTFGGLPSGTPWAVRATVISTGATSVAILGATAALAPITTYAGFSIDKAMLVVPEDIVNVRFASATPTAGYPATNLLSESPSSTARVSSTTGSILFDTAGVPIDTVALLGTMFDDNANWLLRAFSDEARTVEVSSISETKFRCSPTVGRRSSYHGIFQLPAPITARYWLIAFNSMSPMQVMRNLIVGLARRSVNASRGWTQGLSDQGTMTRTRFGDVDRVAGWRGKTVDFEMSWLSEAEYQAKWADLPTLVGKTRSVLAIPNSKRNTWMNDRIAFGPITEWRAENVQSFKFSQSISIDSAY